MWAIWLVAGAAVAVWSLLGWGLHALLTGSGEFLSAQVTPWIASAQGDRWVELALRWGEQFGLIAVWVVWGMGAAGLVLAAVFSTAVLRLVARAGGSALLARWRGEPHPQR